jgi:integrase
LSVWKRGKKWRWKLVINKKFIDGGQADSEEEAYAAKAQARKKAKEEKEALDTTWYNDVVSQYLAHSERRFTKQTFEYKELVYQRFRDHVGNVPINQIDLPMVEGFLATRPTNHNYNIHLKELNALFNWAWRRGLMKINPCMLAERMPESKSVKAIPTPAELHRIILAAGEDRPLLLILYYTLARIDEALRLKWEDVNFERCTVRLWTRKRKHGNMECDEIAMSDSLYDVFKGLWQTWEPHPQGWVFVNPKTNTRYFHRPKLMRIICKRAGVRHYGFHTIRHFVASYMRHKMNRPLGEIKELCRHHSERTTEIYTQNVDANLFETLNKLPNPEIEFTELSAPNGAPPTTLAALSFH